MPIISAFYGIIIRMFYNEHGLPHFHAEYQGRTATFTLDGRLLAGSMESGAALRLIRTWSILRRDDLDANWVRARAGEPLERIEPLS